MSPLFISTMVVVANVTGAGMIVPQVLRLHRVRGADGVSAVWIGIGIALNLFWLGYGFERDLWGVIPVSAMSLVLYGAMAVLYTRIVGRQAFGKLAAGVAGGAAAPLAAVLLDGWLLAGIVLGLAYTVQFAPAVWSALRSPSLAGVATTTWVLAWIEAVAWLAYGIVRADPAITLGGAGGGVMATVILVVLAGERLPRRQLRTV